MLPLNPLQKGRLYMEFTVDIISELKECREGIISLYLCGEAGVTQQLDMLYADTLEHANNIQRWFLSNSEELRPENRS